jgi:para-aminobenzoate synthetase component 1
VYCGSIGYWSVTGALDLNIAIRTAVVGRRGMYFHGGGGIVADSVAADEYAETLIKVDGLVRALGPD